jgi:hypothetical protein
LRMEVKKKKKKTWSNRVYIVIFWVLMPHGITDCHQCLHFQRWWGEPSSSETLVMIFKATHHQNPENHNLNLHCHENLKSCIWSNVWSPSLYITNWRL